MRCRLPYLLTCLTVLMAVSCGSPDRESSQLDFATVAKFGAFVPRLDDNSLSVDELPVSDEALLWLARSVVPGDGWELIRRGWQPVGERATLRLWRRSAASGSLALEFRNSTGFEAGTTYRVLVKLNGNEVGELEASPGRNQELLELPIGVLESENEIVLTFEPPASRAESGALPLTLSRIAVVDARIGRPARSEELFAVHAETRELEVRAAGTLILPLRVPGAETNLTGRIELEGSDAGGLSTFVLEPSGGRRDLGRLALRRQEVVALETELELPSGEQAVLGIEFELPPVPSQVRIRDAEIRFSPTRDASTSGASDGGAGTDSKASAVPGIERPDIVLILLDAARGDRFPGWDYPRQLTPNIDAMAADALVFRRAFSECPTTSCSIPALLSGLAFLPGGAVGEGMQMADEIVTLAEHLSTVGYRTFGFSATPNNSAARNMDQGFDEFHELWGKDNPDHGPFNMSRRAIEVIEDQPAGDPLFLQLHYLPPHQPYAPEPEYDLFTDPGYAGPIWPGMSLQPYSVGSESLEGQDLEHLIGLYDGNLLRADAAVGQVFEALRANGRWERSIILLTSDHGEAFMEHGRQGHNTTLHDEMLHVPLILRLPEGEVSETADPEQQSSLLDVVPTLLGFLNLDTAASLDGRDLLQPASPRPLFFRTSHADHPMFAVRTPNWKLIAWPRIQLQELFDLVRDPAEADNLVGQEPLIYSGLGLILRRHLLVTSGRGEEGEAVSLTPEAEETLKTLGYLN